MLVVVCSRHGIHGGEAAFSRTRLRDISIGDFLDVWPDEIEKNGKPREVASSVTNVLQEYFNSHEHLEIDGEQRLVIRE